MDKYSKLTEKVDFPNGGEVSGKLAMAPMVAQGSNLDGTVGDDGLKYFDKRSDVAALIITGAMYVNQVGKGFKKHMGLDDDNKIAGLKELTKTMKKDGNKAITQIYHGGREAEISANGGEAVVPSEMEFPFLSHQPREMTADEIEETIKDFGKATKRAIEAGFDGVEIHGANHYLLQQFFSAYSNHRTDKWGGSLENRMNFPLAVAEEVFKVVDEYAPEGFIVGYRISHEEVHGENVGYTVEESLQLIDKLLEFPLDYVHISLFTGYDSKPAGSNETYNELFYEKVDGRAKVITVSTVFNADDALKALDHSDMVAIGRGALVEPEFFKKVKEENTKAIRSKVDDNLDELAIPSSCIDWFLEEGSALPPLPGLED